MAKTASLYDNFCKTGNYVIYDVIIWVQDGNSKKMARENFSIGAFYNITKNNQHNPIKTVGRDSFLNPKPKIQVFRVIQPLARQRSHSPYILGDTTRPRHITYVQVWSKSDQRRLRKTLHKETDRHYENNGHWAVNQQLSKPEKLEFITRYYYRTSPEMGRWAEHAEYQRKHGPGHFKVTERTTWTNEANHTLEFSLKLQLRGRQLKFIISLLLTVRQALSAPSGCPCKM